MDEVYAKTADSGLFGRKRDVWFGLIERIEFFSVVADFDIERIPRHFEADSDLMLRGIIVSVFNYVGYDFLDGEVGGEDDFGRCVIALEEPRRRVSRCSKIVEIVSRSSGRNGSREFQTRKIAPSFLPRIRLAPMMVVPRKHMAQTPRALAIKRPSPSN